MWKSAPSGPATSSAKNSPTLRPVIRRTTSPTRNPWVTEWYPAAVPGSHCGACAARRAVADRQSYSSSIGPSQSGRPAVCASRCRTSTPSLPATANSGQYRPTGAARSRSPRSARTSAHSAVIVLVTDQTLVIVFRCHGIVRSESANPPQPSTTGSPSTKTATEAPASPSSSNPASALGTAVNRSSYEPWISAMRRISAHCPPQGQSNWPIDGGGVVALGPHPPARRILVSALRRPQDLVPSRVGVRLPCPALGSIPWSGSQSLQGRALHLRALRRAAGGGATVRVRVRCLCCRGRRAAGAASWGSARADDRIAVLVPPRWATAERSPRCPALPGDRALPPRSGGRPADGEDRPRRHAGVRGGGLAAHQRRPGTRTADSAAGRPADHVRDVHRRLGTHPQRRGRRAGRLSVRAGDRADLVEPRPDRGDLPGGGKVAAAGEQPDGGADQRDAHPCRGRAGTVAAAQGRVVETLVGAVV